MIRTSLFLIIFLSFSSIMAQDLDDKYANDVESIDAIIKAYYQVISGSADDPWQFERDQYIHSSYAIINKIDKNGDSDVHSLEAEYIPLFLAPKEDFYEVELKRKVSKYGNMAQVWSAFEVRSKPEIPSSIRGLNSIQLRFENNRWWIDSWTSEMETESNQLVAQFLLEN